MTNLSNTYADNLIDRVEEYTGSQIEELVEHYGGMSANDIKKAMDSIWVGEDNSDLADATYRAIKYYEFNK